MNLGGRRVTSTQRKVSHRARYALWSSTRSDNGRDPGRDRSTNPALKTSSLRTDLREIARITRSLGT